MIMINFLICFLSLVALTQNLNRDFDIFYFCIIMKGGVWIGFRTL